MTIKLIRPQWDRENLDAINENFGLMEELPNQIESKVSDMIASEVEGLFVPSKNIFNAGASFIPNTSVSINGTQVARTGYSTTQDFIKVQSSTNYQASRSYYLHEFDANGTFLKYSFVPYPNTMTTTIDTKMIRLSLSTANIGLFMLAKGSTPISDDDYMPYQLTLNGANDPQVIEVQNTRGGTLLQNFNILGQAINDIGGSSIEVSDVEAETIFVQEMNKTAKRFDMSDTTFINSTGLTGAGQVTTTSDFAKLAKQALGFDELARVWGAKMFDVEVKGPNARIESIATSVTDPTFETDYVILGGKTGTLGVNINVTGVFMSKATKKIYSAMILRADTDRWQALKQLLDGNTTINAESACAFELQGTSATFVNVAHTQTANSKAVTTKIAPASCTKVMTAIVALESGIKLNSTFEFKESDIVGGSGNVVSAGDIVTFQDALYLMMLPSSNNAAKAIARVVGRMIANNRGYK